jgi:hypothetical protein
VADSPLVSIVVPTYNRAGLVEQTIDSVLAQDYEPLELLVLDDGSSDETPAILARYAERHPDRFRWDRHENMGQARTLNKGFEMSRGEVLGYLSSDDLLAPDAVSRLLGALQSDDEAVLAYPAYRVIDSEGETVDTVVPPEYSRAEAMRLGDTIVGPGALFRRSGLERAGPWDPTLRYLGDFDLWLRLAEQGRFVRVPEPLARWRRHRGALTLAEQGLDMARERIALVERLYSEPVPEELEQVCVQAFRNAYVLAALVVGPGANSAGERYFFSDSHARAVSEASGPADVEAKLAEMRERVADQRRHIEELRESNAALRRALRERQALRHAAAQRVPGRLRPLARRLLRRAARSAT